MAGTLELAHPSFALAGGLVRILGPVVQAFVPSMRDARQHIVPRRAVACQLVADQHARDIGKVLEQAAEEAPRRLLVAPTLDQDIEDVPRLIDHATDNVWYR
jgi:hypothetical protein